MSLARGAAPDLIAVRAELQAGRQSALACLEACLAVDVPHTFIRRFDAQARATATAADALQQAGAPGTALAGLAISVKDLFDVAGFPTTAASRVLAGTGAAATDASVVARLRQAGAALVGHTNLSEFAFSGVGINPHHGTPLNVATARLDATPRVPGGSTSGGAVSVASGAAWAALGSDTGGSIRIPAALQGLVGFKNTQRLTPLAGSVPLSTTLDTACAITHTVRDAVLLHEILAARTVHLAGRPLRGLRLAVPSTVMLDSLQAPVAQAFETALKRLRDAGAWVHELPLPALSELATINAQGGFPAAEAWQWHQGHLNQHEGLYDPRVAQRIRRGAAMTAADFIQLGHARRDWMARMQTALAPFDAALSPTVPMVAPPLAPLLADDAQFFATNALLLRNPAVINFLDGCAISLPCHAEGDLPVGLMVWGPALADDTVLDVALAIEAACNGARG